MTYSQHYFHYKLAAIFFSQIENEVGVDRGVHSFQNTTQQLGASNDRRPMNTLFALLFVPQEVPQPVPSTHSNGSVRETAADEREQRAVLE